MVGRFWTFAVGLALIVLAAHSMSAGGYDPIEANLLMGMIGLLALALLVELIGGWIESAYADRRDLRETMLADRESEREAGTKVTVETDVADQGGAVLAEQSEPLRFTGANEINATLAQIHRGGEQVTGHAYERRWTVREDPARRTGDGMSDHGELAYEDPTTGVPVPGPTGCKCPRGEDGQLRHLPGCDQKPVIDPEVGEILDGDDPGLSTAEKIRRDRERGERA